MSLFICIPLFKWKYCIIPFFQLEKYIYLVNLVSFCECFKGFGKLGVVMQHSERNKIYHWKDEIHTRVLSTVGNGPI